MKQSIYCLHIPRTSGVLIREIVKTKRPESTIISGHKFTLSNKQFFEADYIIGHYGLTPINMETKTFTILRNPDERLFSYLKYIWKHFYNYLPIEEALTFFLTDSHFKNTVSNQQSKFITGKLDVNLYNKKIKDLKDMVYNGWCLTDYSENFNSVKDSVIKNNIDILFYEDSDLYKKVFNIFGIDFSNMDINEKINSSENFNNDLYNKFKEKIHLLNLVDWEVYEYFKK